jgi:hypothetical protein
MTTIYIEERLRDTAKAAGINVSSVCEDALEKATGYRSPETLATRILALKAEIRLLTDIIEDSNNIHSRFDEMLAMFENRHPSGNVGGPTRDQDMTWIRAVKGRYGLQGMRDKELYQKLKEGLA